MAEWNLTQAHGAARLLELIQMRLISEAIYAVTALDIPDLLAGGPATISDLAAKTGADVPSLRRVMRASAVFGIFSEEGNDAFALTPTGELLRSDENGSLRSAALLFGGESAGEIVAGLLNSVQTGKSALEMLHGPWADWLPKNPNFNPMMTVFSRIHLTGVLEAYDFSAAKTIVDVGGGHGRILTEILKKNPAARGVLFDMPHALEGGRKTIAQAGLADRCEVVSGDFFASVPAGGDLYILSRVIHDWNDEQSIAILKNVRRAIPSDGRLILLEVMLRSGDGPLYPVLSDLNMLVRTGGLERSETEYRALYNAAGFELTRAIATASPTGTMVIEGCPAA